MELNIREISVTDVMPVVSVCKSVGIKEIISTLQESRAATRARAALLPAEEKEKDSVIMDLSLDMLLPVIGVVLENLTACEKPLYGWLSSMCGMTEKEFRQQPPAIIPEALYEIVHQEAFGDFFKAVSKFLQ